MTSQGSLFRFKAILSGWSPQTTSSQQPYHLCSHNQEEEVLPACFFRVTLRIRLFIPALLDSCKGRSSFGFVAHPKACQHSWLSTLWTLHRWALLPQSPSPLLSLGHRSIYRKFSGHLRHLACPELPFKFQLQDFFQLHCYLHMQLNWMKQRMQWSLHQQLQHTEDPYYHCSIYFGRCNYCYYISHEGSEPSSDLHYCNIDH